MEDKKAIYDDIGQYTTMDAKKIGEQYDALSENYEQYSVFLGYPNPDIIAECVRDIAKLPLDAKINDFGCGTGLGGQSLSKLGYKNIDGCDASEKLLALCKDKNIYTDMRKLYLCSEKSEIPEEWLKKYDAVISIGLMTYDHCGPVVLKEKMAVLSPTGAGIIAYTMRPEYMEKLGYQKAFDELVEQKKIEFLGKKEFEGYANQDEENCKDERFKKHTSCCFVWKVLF